MISLSPKRRFESALAQNKYSLDYAEGHFHNISKCKNLKSVADFTSDQKYLLISFPKMPYRKSETLKFNYRVAEFLGKINDERLTFTEVNSKEYISLPKMFINKYWAGVLFI